jgi:hypothetical protein
MLRFFIILTAIFATSSVLAQDKVISRSAERSDLFVTVYNKNLGLVREIREIELKKGEVVVEFEDVAQKIQPETVAIKALDKGALEVLEQNYVYDLLSPERLMEKYEGRSLKLVSENPKTGKQTILDAVLLSNHGGGVFKLKDGITFGDVGRPLLPELPANFVTHPTLRWTLANSKAGKRKIEASYLTGGLNWKADYVMVLNAKDNAADLNGWVTLNNQSGVAYKDAKLALVAGDVNRATPQYSRQRVMSRNTKMGGNKGFAEESLFEYHLYSLDRRTTIADRQQKQVSLLEAAGIKVKRVLKLKTRYLQMFDALRGGSKAKQDVEAYIEFNNNKQSGLGMPIPAGVIRVYKADSSGGQQFVGEDRVDHTPRDEKVEIKVGNAFDVVAERTQTDYKRVSKNVHQTAWEVSIRNHKKEMISVLVEEPMSGDWELLKSSIEGDRVDAGTLKFVVNVKPDGETVLTYRVQTKI